MPDWKSILSDTRFRAAALGVVVSAGVALTWWQLHAGALPPPVPPPPAAETTAAATPTTPTPKPDGGAAVAPAAPPAPAEPLRDTARITFVTNPPANATVTWGKTRLGVITPKQALVVERPRDSGPLDVVVRSPGYMQVT